MIKKEEIIQTLNLKPSGNKGWFIGQCPFCGTDGKFGVVFSDRTSSFNCFAGKCGEKGHISKVLKFIGRSDLISFQYNPDVVLKNGIKKDIKETELDLSVETKQLPRNFTRIYESEYLESRNFTKAHFQSYIIGTSTETRLDKYLIFVIIEDGECKGYVARSQKSKKWIDLYNTIAKEKDLKKHLRWINSLNTDFDRLFFGLDEIIVGETKTVILVEGVTSKANVDGQLNLFSNNEMKCLGTFGKTISQSKIQKLKNKGIENIILLYDPDAVNNSKKYSNTLAKHFNVSVGFLKDKDPGDLSDKELKDILNNLQSPFNFNMNQIQKRELI